MRLTSLFFLSFFFSLEIVSCPTFPVWSGRSDKIRACAVSQLPSPQLTPCQSFPSLPLPTCAERPGHSFLQICPSRI